MAHRTHATAPGKIILFGEHAVVYGRPAIAAPLTQVQAEATVETAAHSGVLLRAPDLLEEVWLHAAEAEQPLAAAVRQLQSHLDAELDALTITVTSTIPIASGLGSGAAITAALIRALARHLGRDDLATNAQVSAMTYTVERLYHGTPSGIDNTVVSYERPVYFVSAAQQAESENAAPTQAPHIETFAVKTPLHILVADTGVAYPTRQSVGDVRRLWEADPEKFDQIFESCGRIAAKAREAIETGRIKRLGALMNENHTWLQIMKVSSPELDRLVTVAREAGALGAKLSGGGRGGNMLALVTPETEAVVRQALLKAGAKAVLKTVLGEN